MQEQNTVEQQLAREQQRNVYLAELLKSLEDKLSRAKSSDKQTSSDSRAELEIAQISNLDKKIERYRQELESLKQLSTAAIVAEIRALRTQVEQREQLLVQLEAEQGSLRGEVGGLRARRPGEERNRQLERQFAERQYEMKLLEKRLKELENVEGNRNFRAPRKSARSSSQFVGEKEAEGERKGGVDKLAMYRNLVRFYAGEEEKLRKEIQQLAKQREDARANKQKYLGVQKETDK